MLRAKKQFRPRPGLSLVEVVISTLIVGVMIVASLNTVGAVFRNQRLSASRQPGHGLTHELMSEIMAMPYLDPDGVTGATSGDGDTAGPGRTGFDDVDDYDNWDSPDALAKNNDPLPGYTGWRRAVDVEWANRDDGTYWWLFDTGLLRIVVTVTDPDGVATQLIGLRHKDGALEQVPPIDMTLITWIGAELQLGNSPLVARHGTYLTNHARDAN